MAMTPEEMQRRFLSVRSILAQGDFDALLVCGRGGGDTGRGMIHYLTDHHLLPAGHYFLLVTDEGPIALTQVAETGRAWAERGRWVRRVVVGDNQNRVIAGEIAKSVGESARVGIVGFEELIGLADFSEICEALPGVTFETATTLFDGIRAKKSELELTALRAANDLLCRAMTTASGVIRPGISEREIAAHCLRTIRGLGGSDTTVHIARYAGLGAFHSPDDSAVAKDDIIGIRLKARGVDYYAASQVQYFVVGDLADESLEKIDRYALKLSDVSAEIAANDVDRIRAEISSQNADLSLNLSSIGTDFVEAMSTGVSENGDAQRQAFSISLIDAKIGGLELNLHATVSSIADKTDVFPGSTAAVRL